MLEMADIIFEAKKYGVANLHRDTGISRSHLYGILEGRTEPKVSTLKKILETLGYNLVAQKRSKSAVENNQSLRNKDFLIWSLAKHGAPLLAEVKFNSFADLTQTLTVALTEGRKSAQINAILPYFIYSNWDKIDWELVRKNTLEKLYLAYLINLIFYITNDMKCSKELLEFEQVDKPKTMQLLIKHKVSAYEKKMLKHIDNRIAKTWRFLTADQLSTIEARFKKWANKQK